MHVFTVIFHNYSLTLHCVFPFHFPFLTGCPFMCSSVGVFMLDYHACHVARDNRLPHSLRVSCRNKFFGGRTYLPFDEDPDKTMTVTTVTGYSRV